ncbi:MAG TPA: hypothetical protein VNE58_08600 [Casimicrobiaceae bacterium]|nr:hypothetical protein [Casimicrobiaceae bacterium]
MNDALAGAPETVNADAWNSWLFKIKPAGDDLSHLLDADAYRASVAAA